MVNRQKNEYILILQSTNDTSMGISLAMESNKSNPTRIYMDKYDNANPDDCIFVFTEYLKHFPIHPGLENYHATLFQTWYMSI